MQKLSKLTSPQFAGLCLVLALGTLGLMGLPLRAQEEPKTQATETPPPAGNAAESGQKSEEAKTIQEPPKLQASVPDAKQLFEDAREKLRTRMYRAKIVQKFHFPDRTLQATGEIVRGQKFRMRLAFQIQSGATVGKLLQVSNGDKLWTERRVNDVTRLTVQDVKEILTKAGPAQEDLVIAEMGLGGVTALLASMDRTMNFGEPQPVDIDGEPLLRVDGQWNEAFLARIKSNPQLAKGLTEYIPDGSRVYFDLDDFPRRIQYLKKEAGHDVMRPIVTMDFLDVQWLSEADVKPSYFDYEPPERVYPEDVTKTYVDQLQPRTAPAPPKP
jgi:hypothetical protein